MFQGIEPAGRGFMIERGAFGIIARAHGSFQQVVLGHFELLERLCPVHERLFRLLLFAMQTQQAFAGF